MAARKWDAMDGVGLESGVVRAVVRLFCGRRDADGPATLGPERALHRPLHVIGQPLALTTDPVQIFDKSPNPICPPVFASHTPDRAKDGPTFGVSARAHPLVTRPLHPLRSSCGHTRRRGTPSGRSFL